MRALTLHQPWATFVALGLKRFETRSWETAHRGQLAIHAGKRELVEGRALFDRHRDLLAEHGYPRWEDLPFGAVVAVGTLVHCYMTESLSVGGPNPRRGGDIFRRHAGPLDREAGDWSPGRYGWLLAHVAQVEPPIPARGYQQLWRWDESAAPEPRRHPHAPAATTSHEVRP